MCSALAIVVLALIAWIVAVNLYQLVAPYAGLPYLPAGLGGPLAGAYKELRQTTFGTVVIALNLLGAGLGVSFIAGAHWDFRGFASSGRTLVHIPHGGLFTVAMWLLFLLALHYTVVAAGMAFGFEDAYFDGLRDLWSWLPALPEVPN